MGHRCERHDCGAPTDPGKRFCAEHTVLLELHLATIEIRCPWCGLLAPEGLLRHDCARPSAQPPAAELM